MNFCVFYVEEEEPPDDPVLFLKKEFCSALLRLLFKLMQQQQQQRQDEDCARDVVCLPSMASCFHLHETHRNGPSNGRDLPEKNAPACTEIPSFASMSH